MQIRLLFRIDPDGQAQVSVAQAQFLRVAFQTHPGLQAHEFTVTLIPVLPPKLLQLIQVDLVAVATELASQMQEMDLISQTIPIRQKQDAAEARVPLE
jgi:hypothetical protein